MSTVQSSEWRAVLVATCASSIVGALPMFAVHLYRDGMTPESMLFWRYMLAMSLLLPLAVVTSPSLRDEWLRGGRALFLNGITLGVLQTFSYFRAVQTIPSSIVITVFFTYPAITLLIDRYIYEKTIRRGSVIAVGFVFMGAMLASWPRLSFGFGDPVGLLCMLASPLGFSAYLAVAYRFTRQTSPFAGGACIYGGLAMGYAIIALIVGLKIPASASGWMMLVAIAFVGGVLQILSFAYALPRLSSSGYSIIVSMELVAVVTFGVLLLGETLEPLQIAGIILLACAVVTDRIVRARS
jgi:drug/metabolite transporter (DMT)-like permease